MTEARVCPSGRAIVLAALSALLVACSDVQAVHLGDISRPKRSATNEAGTSSPAPDRNKDADGSATILMDSGAMSTALPASGVHVPPPAAADAGMIQDARGDSRSSDDDMDDDDDEDSEESAERQRAPDEDAGSGDQD